MSDDLLLLSLFVGFEGAHTFSAFMPSAFTIRSFARDDVDFVNLRSGYLPSLILIGGMAATVAALKRSFIPIIVAGLVALGMMALYEYSIQARLAELEKAEMEKIQ